MVDLDHQLVEMTAKRSQLSQIGLGQSTSGSMASLTSTTAATSGLPTSGSSGPSASVVPLISAPGMSGPDANELQTGTNANTGTHSDESDAIAAPILDSAQTSLPSTQPNIAVTARPPIPPGLINAGQAAAPLPTHTPTSNSLVSLAAAAFSTGSLGRRRKDSSGTPASSSLSSASLTSLLQLGSVEGSAATGSLSSTAAAVRQRQSLLVELDERIHFVEDSGLIEN
ncbi:unnamed protein product [Protopolystoma xenopodis]|uniref:Uncharacterized protein n=1 Tax=Protopolystoma xenopodis TaxID=117903 RepID=A0A448WUU3_9PLAT|nr:unnamed protein product [Protopolystoma xenopodis]